MSQGWPTFGFANEGQPVEMFVDGTGTKVFCKMHATTANGMDSMFGHVWEVDPKAGKLKAGYFYDDSVAWFKYKTEQ